MARQNDNDIGRESAEPTVDFTADIEFLHGRGLLEPLLLDHATNRPIVWATDAYADLGKGFQARDCITSARIRRLSPFRLRPRAAKSVAARASRTKTHAEVFTPLHVCRRMIDAVPFPTRPEAFLRATCLEIAYGEAPFLVQRYDPGTGRLVPLGEQDGILDRKLRVCSELADGKERFLKLALAAVRSVYGCELQGDSLLIARINVLLSVLDAYRGRFGSRPDHSTALRPFALAIAWNLFQVDMLTGTVPFLPPPEAPDAPGLFSLAEEKKAEAPTPASPPVPRVRKWTTKKALGIFPESDVSSLDGLTATQNAQLAFPLFAAKTDRPNKKEHPMKFDYVIGNPPYQEETDSESTRMPPIYNFFMNAAYSVADKVCLITPARFLFNAGYTPRAWNEKMLADPHLTVLEYVQKSDTLFPNIDIKGGVAITYRDGKKEFGAIGTFTVFPELNSILHKVRPLSDHALNEITAPALSFKLSPLMLEEHPDSLDRLRTSCFETLSEIFHETKPRNRHSYILMLGILNNRRTYRWVRRDYLTDSFNRLDKYKVILPASNGSGMLGEVLSTPLVGEPGLGVTQSFITIGSFDARDESEACLKYIKTKFVRAMLGILKITQHNPPEKWRYVPLQDFTPSSDIDWSEPVAGIDRQLYAKYGLTAEEIAFVETHVREME